MAIPTPTLAPVVLGQIMQGVGSAVWVPTVANLATPTLAEMSAGTEYKNQIAALDGFAPSGSTVDVPNMGTRQTPNAPGLVTLGTGTVTFNLSRVIATVDARTVFNDGTDGSQPTTGAWYFTPNGLVTSAKMRGFLCVVTSAVPSMALDAVQTLAVEFAIQQATGFITVPAA